MSQPKQDEDLDLFELFEILWVKVEHNCVLGWIFGMRTSFACGSNIQTAKHIGLG